MSRKINVAVVGTNIGLSHLNAFKGLPERFEVAALCDINPAKGREVAETHHIPRFYEKFDALCRDPDIDVIDICTPSYLHFEQALAVLAAGKHAIIEKPVGASLRDVDQLIAAETASGRHAMPIFQYRFGHGLQKLKWLVDQGVAGRAYLTTIETAWRRRPDYYANPWRGRWQTELGGPLVTLAIHAHDSLYQILGKPKRVFARMATRVNAIETEDCISATLEMADGSLCSSVVTTGSAREISRYRFCFSDLTAESNLEPYTNTADPWQFTADSGDAEARIEAALARFTPRPEWFIGQFARFADALEQGTELPVTLADARNAIELITALYESASQGRDIPLPIGPDQACYTGWHRN